MDKKISVALLSGFIMAFANWGILFQSGLKSDPAKAFSLPPQENSQTVHKVIAQLQENESNSGQPVNNPQMDGLQYGQITKPVSNLLWSVPTADRVVFLTIDDGWYPSESILEIMREKHIPISAFITVEAAEQHPGFWQAFLAAGGDIQNHTVSHPNLKKQSLTGIESEIETAQEYLTSLTAIPPTLFRPPYGNYNQSVCREAYRAGIKHVILWNATMSDDGLQTYNGKSLEPGSIILLHWVPDLAAQLEELLDILNREELGVASLPYALAHPEKFPIILPLNRKM
ncbi:MAG: polysaccharide deacetylase family protein [Peptococcaceae bacterium]|nr:polysaccharide deacetylase family protein [Peptococcaceae bacterium]